MRLTLETNRPMGSTIAIICLMMISLLGLLPNRAFGQIDVNEADLHSGQYVYGLEATTASPPYVNLYDISLWAWGATDANLYTDVHFLAYGLSSDVDLENSGEINVNAMGGSATSTTLFNGDVNGYGIYSDSNVNNTGRLTVNAIAGDIDAETAIASASAYGFMVPNGSVTNSGNVAVLAAAGTAVGDVQATVHASARGIYSYSNVSNSGAINVTSIGGDAFTSTIDQASASAYASVTGLLSYTMIENTGDITVAAVGGTAEASEAGDSDTRAFAHAIAHGIEAYFDVVNSGNVSVTATAGSADANEGQAYAYGDAFGISSAYDITNTGDITVSVTGGMANAPGITDISATAYGLVTDHGDVNNTGDMDIRATTTDGTGLAYGIYLIEDGELTNTGTVRVSGDTAYEVYVRGGTVTLVDTYNVALDGDPNRGSLGVADGATLDLNDATLTVTHVAGETLWDTEYRLFDTEGSGVVDGNFAEAKVLHPHTTLTYNDQGTSGAADDTVALSFTPTGSAFAGSTAVERQLISQSSDIVHHRMTGAMLQNIILPGAAPLADADTMGPRVVLSQVAPENESVGIFIEPYYSQIEKDEDPVGHDARLWGFAAGYERWFDKTLVCFHIGRGQADIDYTGEGFDHNSEDQEIFTGGFSALKLLSNWTLRYGVSGFYAWQDYRGLTGLELDETETASTNSYGVIASAMAGRIFRRGAHIFLPEAGLNYLWGHRDRYTTDATESAWDTTYSEMDEHDIEVEAALRWLAGFAFKGVHVTPSASVGVRHLLTDDESEVSLSVPGSGPHAVISKRDRTAMTLSGSVTLTGDIHAISLAYDGEFSDNTDRHSVWLRYGWQF